MRRKSVIFSSLSLLIAGLGVLAGISILLFQFITRTDRSGIDSDYSVPNIGSVLYINSYDPSYIISQYQLQGIVDSLKKKHIRYEVAFMDMKNYDSEKNTDLFYENLKFKLQSVSNFDAVIVSDDAALHFADKYHDELFPELPVVFFGINDIAYAESAAKNPYFAGSAERIFVEETIEIAIEQNPKVDTVICLLDDSLTGQGDMRQFYKAISKYPNIECKSISISRLSMNQLAEVLFDIPKNSIIICVSSLQDYAHSHSVTGYELVNFIQGHTYGIPIYRTNEVGIGAGFVGGIVYDHYNAAREACDTAMQIINGGKTPSDFPLSMEMNGRWVFDWSVLKKYNLNVSTLPRKTVFVNKEKTFFENNRSIILPFILICISMLGFIVVTSVNYTKSRKANSVMVMMNKRMRQTNKELVASKTKLTYIANNDSLTGLPNRAYAEKEINRFIHSGVPFSIFLMDVDDFKNYNDTYTHACGDFVLKEYGRRLSSLTINNEYFAARYGGDEFILVHKCGHIDKNSDELEKLHKLMNESVEFNGLTLDITATLGFADSDPELTYDELLTNADIAMYEAKMAGKGTIVAFVPEMKESIIKRNKITDILKEEISRGGFEIRYQPQVSTESGDVYGYEALVRLQDYPVGPGEFIPVAEDSGFIAQIGRIVTEKVLKQMDIWRRDGMELKKVAINYSNGQLVDDEYVKFLKTLMDRYCIPPELVEIEITESLFMGNFERAKQLFDELGEIGVGLALDDFGTGYSSLSYLTFVPAGKVKIDKSLVDNYLVDGKEKFIENIVHLVHDLGMKLTVEGVEHKWQYDKLCAMKCDYIQGYFFSKPMGADSVPQFSVAL